MKGRVLLVSAACGLMLAPAADARVHVWFTAGGTPVSVARSGKTIEAAIQLLLAGPTAVEQRRGVRSSIPRATPLLSVTVERRIVTVDLGARFASGRDEVARAGRVAQLIRTVRSIPGVIAVKILIEGGVPVGLFPGYELRQPITKAVGHTTAEPTQRELRQRLVDLGFLASTGVTRVVDDQTSTAVLGFQKWANLSRDGSFSPATVSALLRATRPTPALEAPGRRIEVQLRRQVALLVEDNRVVRVVHISSGAGGRTPHGSFSVYRKERYSWSVPFKVWLPWASYFTGGIAFHEYGSVPAYAASHGCIRVNRYDAPMLFGFAESGTRVDVFDDMSAA